MSIAVREPTFITSIFTAVDTQRELETLGLDDLRADSNGILLIEWGEKFPRLQRERDVEISLERQGENGRKITVVG